MNRLFNFNLETNIIKINYNYRLGHDPGQCQISDDYKYSFIHIPKNASSSAKDLLIDWQYSNYYHHINKKIEHLVILRDPTTRWISGITEFFLGNNSVIGNKNKDITLEEIDLLINSKMFQNLLFEFVIFDNHTLPQCCFIQDIDISNITFFYHDQQVIDKIKKYLNINDRSVKKNNSSIVNKKKKVMVDKLKNLLSENPKLQERIDVHYYADSKLFDLVKFY